MSRKIRNATPADARAILDIYAPYVTDTSITFETEVPTIEEFMARMENIQKSYPYLVYEVDGVIVGYAYASKHRERAAYRYSADVSIYVEPSYHKQGIGKALYTKLFDMLRTQGIYTAYACITVPNDASIELHKSLGFTEVGVFHNDGYKLAKWHDVIWLEKALREYNNPESKDMSITIRLAVPDDAPDMAKIIMCSWEAAYKDFIPAEYIREKNSTRPQLYKRIITEENTNSYVIQYNGKTVGIMCVAPPRDNDAGDDFYELHYIYLHPDYFRQGIGTRAMEYAFNKARCLGKKAMTLWVFAENRNAVKFYERCGFAADGCSREQNPGVTLKSIRMRRYL